MADSSTANYTRRLEEIVHQIKYPRNNRKKVMCQWPCLSFSLKIKKSDKTDKTEKNETPSFWRHAFSAAGLIGCCHWQEFFGTPFHTGDLPGDNILIVEDTYHQVISCDKNICTLQITDTTGSHKFPAMKRLTISKGYTFMLVYSVTSRQSVEELQPIYEKICQIKGTSAKMNYNVQEFSEELLNLEKEKKCSLQVDGKNSKQQQNKDKLRSKCSVILGTSLSSNCCVEVRSEFTQLHLHEFTYIVNIFEQIYIHSIMMEEKH
ncbi:GTP-binding protein Di-Ras2, partial [Ophiophagus hannah]